MKIIADLQIHSIAQKQMPGQVKVQNANNKEGEKEQLSSA
jgi:hypothetical protein